MKQVVSSELIPNINTIRQKCNEQSARKKNQERTMKRVQIQGHFLQSKEAVARVRIRVLLTSCYAKTQSFPAMSLLLLHQSFSVHCNQRTEDERQELDILNQY